MKINKFIIYVLSLSMMACVSNKGNDAQERIDKVHQYIEDGKYNQAKIELDSIHILYPRQVELRRQAKALQDTVLLIEAERNIQYADSVRKLLEQERDELVASFIYDEPNKYLDKGKYTHRSLYTPSTTQPNLQAYVDEDANLVVKSYYAGAKLNHQNVIAISNQAEQLVSGSLYAFDNQGIRYEITTMNNEQSLLLLNFINSNVGSKVQIRLAGDKEYTYTLTSNQLTALNCTYQLAIILKDIKSTEEIAYRSYAIINSKRK